MQAPWVCGAVVALACVLIAGCQRHTWAASRPVFPDLRVHERLHDTKPQRPSDIDALYLYGTLSLLERRSGPYRIDVSGVEHPPLLPLAVFDIYHDIPTYIQSEFSDYTLWGVWGDRMFHDAILAMAQADQTVAHPRRTRPKQTQNRSGQRALGLGINPLGRGDKLHFDLRSDHTFGVGEMTRLQGEQRQFGVEADFHVGRGGVDYHKRGIIARTLQRILQLVHALMDNKVLAVVLLGMFLLVAKVTQGILSRPS